MKNTIAIAILMILGLTMNAQKTIEKNIDYKDQEINIDLDFATNIEIKTWEKPSVYIKADLSTGDTKYLDLYTLDVSEGASEINIKSNAHPIFEAFQKEHKKNYTEQRDNYIYVSPKHEFNYILYVPKGSKVKVSSISGHLSSENIEGDFTADLISGNINIKHYKGNLNLTTISGEIDLKIKNASLTAETIQGNIYADEKLKFSSTDRMVGHKIAGETADVSSTLTLNTITGNMYLRY
ncbi:hypothetical protein JM83_0752 [Gillisia sp. Hel_I_86]|uniref:hypothetical protein n=1 Tax=Gillisia sp. Hel_I_86 TaxID=1249981 RepID=UPI00119A9D26|nr:hypothetical protein [Gillisia sp. Hel_I_86]TVZ25821.1 hypothetical protein JM83_0752 [Gillisia sp. Hel_I_86]